LHCFGGAGGQHACRVADALGMETVIIHPLSGLLSAFGMGLADIRAGREAAVEAPLDDHILGDVAGRAATPPRHAVRAAARQGVARDAIEGLVRLHLRYSGTDSALVLEAGGGRDLPSAAALRERFEALHRRRFGFVDPTRSVTVEAVSVEAAGGGAGLPE